MALVVPTTAQSAEDAELFHVDIGGAESNVACHLAGAGKRTAWFGAVGDDALGRRLLRRLDAAGVDVASARRDPSAPTGLYVKDPGTGVVYYRTGSAASRLGPEDLADLDWDHQRLLHLSGITPALSPTNRAMVVAAIDTAHTHDCLVSFDINFRPALWPDHDEAAAVLWDIARFADVVLVGRDEAETVWGTATADAIRTNLFLDVPHLVVKDADLEATEFSEAGRVSVPASRVDVVEPVGAGDAFAAGWLDGFLDGADSHERLTRGHRMAAVALSSTTDIPRPAAPAATTPGEEHHG